MDRVTVSQSDRVALDERIEQLTRELAEATEQQIATSEVLHAIGRSASEVGPVFGTVLRHAVRLCAADAGMVYRLDGDLYRVAAALGGPPEYRRYIEEHPQRAGLGSLVGRVGLERQTVQIVDAAVDPQYERQEARRLGGFHSMLGVPMVADDRVVGVIALWRSKVDPFADVTIELATTFAAQGVIAIRNVELFQELQERGRQLAHSVDELQALGEVSQAVSSSLDLDEVLTTIVTRAAELSQADGGSIFEFEPSTSEFVLRTCSGTSGTLEHALRDLRIKLGETFMGEAAASGVVQQAPDLEAEPADPHIDMLLRHGWRSMVAVPLRREDEIIGALIVRRKTKGALPAATVALLETLASQSVVAILNARVFRELETKTHELEVASQHKSEFLASMSHELRTPLNAVIGFSDVLLDRMFGDLNERQDEYVRDIRNSGRHLLDLINEILDLSRVEAGRMDLDLDAVSLEDALEHGVAMIRERAGAHGIAVEVQIEPDLGRCARRRAQAQAGRREPAQQRRQVQHRRRVGHGHGRTGRRRRACQRPRHGDRHRPGPAGAHLRGLPARRSHPQRERGGDGPRAHALQATRRPPRWAPVDGERAGRRQHVLLLDPAHRRRGRRRRRRARPAPTKPAWSWWSRTTAARPTCCGSTSRTPATPSRSRATAPRGSTSPAAWSHPP